MIVVSLACINGRRNNLLAVTGTLSKQCDILIVHTDFQPNANELPFCDKIRLTVHDRQTSEIRMDDAADYTDSYYFMVDDDILYPHDYTLKMCAAIDQVNANAIICIHGSILNFSQEREWYASRTVLHFANELSEPRFVDVPGAGTSCFHTSKFKPGGYLMKNMTDIQLALMSKLAGLPIISISRPAGWLKPIPNNGESIYGSADFQSKRNAYVNDNIKIFRTNEK